MPTPSAINTLTITQIIVRHPSDEEWVIKHKENLWTLKQKLKDNPQVQEAVAKGAELHHPLRYFQMHFRSSLKGLTGFKTSKMSNLTS